MRFMGFATSALLAASTLGACATKGYVQRGLEDQRVALSTSMTSTTGQERTERVAGDSALRGDINGVKADLASLRNDLAGLKNEFNTRISVVEGQVKFAMPV